MIDSRTRWSIFIGSDRTLTRRPRPRQGRTPEEMGNPVRHLPFESSWPRRLTGGVRVAFKEWAVIVDALGRGDQIVILRKGGISEEPGGFRVDRPEFLLFPTLFHQQRESVLGPAQARYDVIARDFPPATILRLELFAEVAAWRRVESAGALAALRGQHVWRDEVVTDRFAWGLDRAIFALAVRVVRLAEPIELPMLPTYGGCKSWIELDRDIGRTGATAVLKDSAFSAKLKRFEQALDGA